MNLEEHIRKIANYLDETGKADAAIEVRASRRTLVPLFKPDKRGGDLRIGGHQIIPRQIGREPEPENLDWIGEGAQT